MAKHGGEHFMKSKATGHSKQVGHEHTKSEGTKLGSHEKRKTGKGIEQHTKPGRGGHKK